MRNSPQATTRRGIVAVRANTDPAAMIGKITLGLEDFKKRHSDELVDIRSMIADIATKNSARGLNGGGHDEGDRTAVNAAFRDYIRGGDVSSLQALQVSAGMSAGSDPEGGYSVYPTVSNGITTRIFETSPLRRYARAVTISSDKFEELVDINEPDSGWVGEKQARPETDTPNLGKLEILAHELYAMPKVTQKLLDDSSLDLAAWLIDKVSAKLGRQETAAFFNGNGILKPRGFLTRTTAATADATRAWGTLQHVVSGHASGFLATDVDAGEYPIDCLIDLQTALKSEHRANAVWMMNRRTAGVVRKFKDADGASIWSNSNQAGQPPLLLGHPVELAEDMPDVEANALPIAFGDFMAGYTIVERHGDRLLRDPFTAKPHVLFYTYRRVGGDVSNSEAIKLLKIST